MTIPEIIERFEKIRDEEFDRAGMLTGVDPQTMAAMMFANGRGNGYGEAAKILREAFPDIKDEDETTD